MKKFRTARIVIGILSMVFFLVIMLQSCSASVVNSIDGNTTDTSAGGGTLLAFLMLISGVVAVVGRDQQKTTRVAGILYIVAALIGFISLGTFGDLLIWSIASLIFGAVFVYSSTKTNPPHRPQTRRPAQQGNRRPAPQQRRPQQRPNRYR